MKKLVRIVLVSVLISSCSSDSPDYENSKNYIGSYYYHVNRAEVIPSLNSSYYTLQISGTEAKWYDANKQKYDSLANLYDDLSFNKPFVYMTVEPVLADTITRIDFICKQEFDEKHPQNTNINDLIEINSGTNDKYIKSGYKLTETLQPIQQPLPAFNDNEHILMGSNVTFFFTKKPINRNSCDIICIGYNKDKILFEISNTYDFN